jgi:probable phosphoglycerate mutase
MTDENIIIAPDTSSFKNLQHTKNLTLYIIRHGETDLNKRGIIQGRGINTDLNDHGRLQAASFYEKYKEVPFEKVYTSSLKRTHQTVQKFIDISLPWIQLPGLDELAWGIYEGKEGTLENRAIFREMLENWTKGDLHFKFEGGESPLEVKERQLEALEEVMKASDDNNVLICMHGRAMRLFLCVLLDLPLSEMEKFPHQNTCLYKVYYDGSKFEIVDFNNIDHLKNLV